MDISVSTNLTKQEAINFVDTLSEEERQIVENMLTLCGHSTLNEIRLQETTYRLEKCMEQNYRQIYNKRTKILEHFRPMTAMPSNGFSTGNLAYFWLKVFKHSGLAHFINKQDEQILRYLKDVRCKIHLKPISKFVIEFHFEHNKYFSNPSLRKSFYLNCFDGYSNPLSYEGDKVIDCYGSITNWRIQNKDIYYENLRNEVSFFEFFNVKKLRSSPLQKPNTTEADLKKFILQNSLKIGIYIKDCLIPAAVLYFIGQINETEFPMEKWLSDDDLNIQNLYQNTEF